MSDLPVRVPEIIRAVAPGPELRAADEDAGMPTLFGHFARFNEWTEINSYFEGTFLERIAPGAFKKTIRERGDKIRALFQHGRDPQVGDKPLGPFRELREDADGVYYEVPLLDTAYNRDLVPGLEAGLYGASFRMEVLAEDVRRDPKPSEHNPDGLDERTIKEIRLFEGGPVTFPAYEGATASVRSLTDEFAFERLTANAERTRTMVAFVERTAARDEAEEAERAADDTSDEDVAGDALEDARSEEAGSDVPAERQDEQYAPEDEGAETESHAPEQGRAKQVPLYGTEPKTPAWRL